MSSLGPGAGRGERTWLAPWVGRELRTRNEGELSSSPSSTGTPLTKRFGTTSRPGLTVYVLARCDKAGVPPELPGATRGAHGERHQSGPPPGTSAARRTGLLGRARCCHFALLSGRLPRAPFCRALTPNHTLLPAPRHGEVGFFRSYGNASSRRQREPVGRTGRAEEAATSSEARAGRSSGGAATGEWRDKVPSTGRMAPCPGRIALNGQSRPEGVGDRVDNRALPWRAGRAGLGCHG